MDWTPNGTETVATLRGKLTQAGLTVGRIADVPANARRAMPHQTDPADSFVPGLTASIAVKGMVDGYNQIRALKLNALADVVAKTPVLLASIKHADGRPNGNNQMATTGGPMAILGAPQWLTINVNGSPPMETAVDHVAKGSPWIVRDALADVRSGKLTPREGDQRAYDVAAVHEFGHVLDNLSGDRLSRTAQETVERATGADSSLSPAAYSRRMRDWLIANVSGYGASSAPEMTAEAFSLAAHGKAPAALKGWSADAMRMARTGAWL